MKRKYITLSLVVVALITITSIAFVSIAGESEDETKIVSGIKALNPAIVSVRPAHVNEQSRPKFKTVWMPALTLKKDISQKEQEKIASQVARFVVEFQKGVPTEGVMGGVIAFFEGDGWTPYIGQVFYKVGQGNPPEVFVMTARNMWDESGNVSCCDDDKLLGRVSGAKFIPDSK